MHHKKTARAIEAMKYDSAWQSVEPTGYIHEHGHHSHASLLLALVRLTVQFVLRVLSQITYPSQ